MVSGDLQNDKWEKDGQKRVKTKLVAQNVVFVSSKGDGSGGNTPANEAPGNNDDSFSDIPF
jgi:single-stranded DNA-binding protein